MHAVPSAVAVYRTVPGSRNRSRRISTSGRSAAAAASSSGRDSDFDAKLDRIEQVTKAFPNRCFAFDQFGPLLIRPHHGSKWAPRTAPGQLPATYTRTPGLRCFHGCYSLGDDQLWGAVRKRKGDKSQPSRTDMNVAPPKCGAASRNPCHRTDCGAEAATAGNRATRSRVLE